MTSTYSGIDSLRHRVEPRHDRGEGRKRLELVTTREKAATAVANAPADWVITPNWIWPAMYAGAMIKTGMIWIIQL